MNLQRSATSSSVAFDSFGVGNTLILAGSCSKATLAQIKKFRDAGHSTLKIDPRDLATGSLSVSSLAERANRAIKNGPVLIHGSANAEDVRQAQKQFGRERAGKLIETVLSELAAELVQDTHVAKIVVAGGETSGAVVSNLGAVALRIGKEIDPGVPWTIALDQRGRPIIPIALKSGNFGDVDFFLRASVGVSQ